MKRLRLKIAFLFSLGGLFVGISAMGADIVKPQPKKKIKVPLVRIGYENDRMTAPRVIDRANRNPGVVTGDSLSFTPVLVSANVSLDPSRYTWSGEAAGQGSQISASFNTPGNRPVTLSVLDKNSNRSKSFTATTRVRFVGPEKENDICPSSDPATLANCTLVATDAALAEAWAHSGDMAVALNFARQPCTSDDGKCNAAKHSYWNLLMVRDVGQPFAARFATAHERFSTGFIIFGPSGLDAGSAHNSVVMDLDNNAAGRAIGAGMTFESGIGQGDEPGKAAIAGAVNSGAMAKLSTSADLDDTNPESSGLLEPTNQ